MEARRFSILRELVVALAENQDSLKRGAMQAQLSDWAERLDNLGNVENEKLDCIRLGECSDRAAGGQVELLNAVLAPNLDEIESLNQLLPTLGDFEGFKQDLTTLQSSVSDWNRRPEIYNKLVEHGFPQKLKVFEEIVKVLRSIKLKPDNPR